MVPENSIVAGVPATVIRSRNSWVANRFNALLYHRNAESYARGDHRGWDGPDFERWRSLAIQIHHQPSLEFICRE